MTMEFVVFDKDGNEIDSIDPVDQVHDTGTPGSYVVDNGFYEYPVQVPEGGRYEIREKEDRR